MSRRNPRASASCHDVPRAGRDHGDDLIPVDIVVSGAACFVATRALPPPAAGIPIIAAPLPCGVDDRDAFGASRFDQRLDVFEGHPGLLAAGGPPALDRVKDMFRTFPQNAQLTSITSNAGRLPNPARAPNPPAANMALSRSVRNLSQIRSFIEIPPQFVIACVRARSAPPWHVASEYPYDTCPY